MLKLMDLIGQSGSSIYSIADDMPSYWRKHKTEDIFASAGVNDTYTVLASAARFVVYIKLMLLQSTMMILHGKWWLLRISIEMAVKHVLSIECSTKTPAISREICSSLLKLMTL